MTWKSHDFPTTVMTGVPAATSAFMLASSSTFFPTLRVIPKAHMAEFLQRILRARSKNSCPWGCCRVAALDEVDAELVQLFGDRDLVEHGQGDLLGLGPVRSVVSYRCTFLIRRPALPIPSSPFDATISGGVFPNPNAAWRTRTASSVYFSSMRTEILISEVEIPRMLIPSPQRLEHLQGHPGMGTHRHSDDGDLGDLVVPTTRSAPTSFAAFSVICSAFL